MLKFIFHNVFRKKFVAILSSAGIGFGLMLMLVLGAFSNGVTAQINENFSRVVGIIEITEAEQAGANSQLPTDIIDKILASPAGTDVQAYTVNAELPTIYTRSYSAQSLLLNPTDAISVIGTNLTLDKQWEGPTTKIRTGGRTFAAESYEGIIDSRLIDNENIPLNVTIGDNITLYLDYPNTSTRAINITIVGIYEQEDLGAPEFVSRQYYLYIDLKTAWNIVETGWKEPYTYFDYYTKLSLRYPATTSEEIKIYLDQVKEIQDLGVQIDAFSLGQFQESIGDTLSIFETFTTVISVITALAGGMAIIVAQLNSVTQRMAEFAIFKATGWKNRHIFQSVVLESLILGALGAIIGLALGFGLITAFASGIGPFSGIQAKVTWQLVLNILVFALGLGIIGGLYPGFKAANVRPVTVLKGG